MKKFVAILLSLGLVSAFAAEAVHPEKKAEVKTEKKAQMKTGKKAALKKSKKVQKHTAVKKKTATKAL